MKIKKFIKKIEDFFETNKKEETSLFEALSKLEEKRQKIVYKLENSDFKDENKNSLEDKLKLVAELKRKIEKKLNKLKIKNSKE